jgi:hypothetical protein
MAPPARAEPRRDDVPRRKVWDRGLLVAPTGERDAGSRLKSPGDLVTSTSTSIKFAAPRRLGQAVAGTLFVGAVALGHAGLAGAQPVDTTKKWNSDEMSACVEAGIDRGAGSTFDGLNGLIFDCCLAAGGNPTYDHGPNSTVTCPEAAANGSQQQPGRPAQ